MAKENRPGIRLLAGLGVEGDAHMGEKVRHRYQVRRDPDQPNLCQVHLIHAELHDELRGRGFEIARGGWAQARHDLAGAEEWYRKSLEVSLRLGDEHTAALTYAQLGVLAAERRDGGCANNFLQALRRFVACKDSHYAGRALAGLRRAYQDGLVTRQGMEEAWQAAMGEPLSPDWAEVLFSPAGQQEGGASPSQTAE
jgi:hypothetical protein